MAPCLMMEIVSSTYPKGLADAAKPGQGQARIGVVDIAITTSELALPHIVQQIAAGVQYVQVRARSGIWSLREGIPIPTLHGEIAWPFAQSPARGWT